MVVALGLATAGDECFRAGACHPNFLFTYQFLPGDDQRVRKAKFAGHSTWAGGIPLFVLACWSTPFGVGEAVGVNEEERGLCLLGQ